MNHIKKPLNLGVIDYLNILPVYYGILQGTIPVSCSLEKGVPTALNEKMAKKELDLSVISSFEYLKRSHQYYLLPNLSVSANGPVHSIYLFSHQPFEQLEGTVFLTPTSYTSNHLVQYFLRNHPVDFKPLASSETSSASNQMLIGDEAIRVYHQKRFPYVYDLAELWKVETQLPFVFAVWAVQRDVYAKQPEAVLEVYQALMHSKAYSQQNFQAMAETYNQQIFPSLSGCVQYLKNLRYDLSPPFREGLMLFQQHCYQMGFLDQLAELVFIDQ